MRQTWLCIYRIFIIRWFNGFCESEVIYLHLNVMQRSSDDLISSVKGNGSSMKRCSKDSKMCVCKYNPDWHVLKIMHVWVWPKWFWQTHNIFLVIFLNWIMLISSGSSVISCPRWRLVESHISWNSLFLSANWFIIYVILDVTFLLLLTLNHFQIVPKAF